MEATFLQPENADLDNNKGCEPPQHAALVWYLILNYISFPTPSTIVVTTYFLRKNAFFYAKKSHIPVFLIIPSFWAYDY